MITYEELNKMTERWRVGVPNIDNEQDRRLIYLALVVSKSMAKNNVHPFLEKVDKEIVYPNEKNNTQQTPGITINNCTKWNNFQNEKGTA